MKLLVTRFAPSPTGFLHVGGLRTAAYAYALAKSKGGKFILRIEDTDQKREVEGAREKIYKTLKIFGISWDELHVQSERVGTGVYEDAAQQLVTGGVAFYCQCETRNAKQEGYSTVLRDPCRDKGFTTGAVKLKVPEDTVVEYVDYVGKKKISWHTKDVADTTLLKSDGFPTYHLAVVVDDHEMQVSHVLRGHDWLPSTPIHLLVYQFLGFEKPEFGHLTDIQDPSGGKLSKRKGNVSCEQFLADGYLPEALLNFVILLGWAPKDNRELFTLEEFIENFDENGFQKANPVFNTVKLDWFNGEYIRSKTDEELFELLKPFVPETADSSKVMKLIPLTKERIKKLSEFWPLVSFVFEEPEIADKNLFSENYKTHLEHALRCIEESEWSTQGLTDCFMSSIKSQEFNTSNFFMDLRLAFSGKKITPPLNDSIVLLDKKTAIDRLNRLQ